MTGDEKRKGKIPTKKERVEERKGAYLICPTCGYEVSWRAPNNKVHSCLWCNNNFIWKHSDILNKKIW